MTSHFFNSCSIQPLPLIEPDLLRVHYVVRACEVVFTVLSNVVLSIGREAASDVLSSLVHHGLFQRLSSLCTQVVLKSPDTLERGAQEALLIVSVASDTRPCEEAITLLQTFATIVVWARCEAVKAEVCSPCAVFSSGEEMMACGKVSQRVAIFSFFFGSFPFAALSHRISLLHFLRSLKCVSVRYCSRGPAFILPRPSLPTSSKTDFRRRVSSLFPFRPSEIGLERAQEGVLPIYQGLSNCFVTGSWE